ncbi:hypothetical protein Tco_0135075 [Tanacetum coccineum]
MGDENSIRTLGDYSIPSNEGYKNTIELLVGNNVNKPPNQNLFTFHERTGPNPQPQALGTTFEARVRGYMAAHTERMERFKNAIFKQREEINERMAEMFGLLKELTTNRTPEKVLIREDAKSLVTKNVNSISLARREEERNDKDDIATDGGINETNTEIPVKEAEKENKAEDGTKNEPIRRTENKEAAEGPVYEAIHKKKITRKEDIGGNLEIPYFVILDIKEDEKRPFILGTSFLTTAKAAIKFDKGTITLRFGKRKINFHMIPESLYKGEKGIKNDIEPIAPIMTVNRLVLEWEEKIKLHQEREMEFDRWRNKNFKNEHPTHVKIEDGMDDEGEVT